MEYRVEQLAAAAGMGVDTVRFYQNKGLLPPPKKVKRAAVYSEAHLETLRRIRRYQSQGLKLATIKRLLTARAASPADALLGAVADQSGDRVLTRAQLAAMSGVPETFLSAIESAGLLAPVPGDGEPRYGEADVQMLRAGTEIIRAGFPIGEILALAMRHDRGTREVVDAAIDLFDRHVRRAGADGTDPRAVAEMFRQLLPAVTTLVAQHFQRVLLSRALERLRAGGHADALELAREVAESGRLGMEVVWR